MNQKRVILIHGWDPAIYNSVLSNINTIEDGIGWNKSPRYISYLEENFTLVYCNLPGFCGVPEPTDKSSFSIDDFSDYFMNWKKINCPSADLILGYSFGGAVAINFKVKNKDDTPLVLISPALLRYESGKSRIAKISKAFIPVGLQAALKSCYQWMMSKYYRHGTPFLRASYDLIVRDDLSKLICEVKAGDAKFIFGSGDRETPWELVKDKVIGCNHSFNIIQDSSHSLVKSHPRELISIISNYMKEI